MGEVTYTDYAFKTQPYKHQHDCWKISRDKTSFALFLDMGCGKTKVILDTAGYLYQKKEITGHIIVAPKGVYLNWVDEEIPKHMSDAVPIRMAYWSSYARKRELQALEDLYKPGECLRILVVNIEAFNSEKAVNMMVKFMSKYKCLMTIDESTTIKNPRAKRTKICINLGKYAAYRRICSGNPIPNGPLDLYSQSEFLRKNLMGFTNFYAFRNRFAVMQNIKLGKQSFDKVVGYKDLAYLKTLMNKFAFIIKKEDCLDLPEKIYMPLIDVEMGPHQTKAYKEMREDAIVILEDGASTAQMAMTQLLRLHQIACGFIKPDDMDEIPFGEPNDRIEQMLEIIDQAPGKVIIWATYRYNIQQIISVLSEKYGKDSVVHYYGSTSTDDRRDAKRLFQDPNSTVKYMVSNPETGKWGNTWVQATTVIYYSNNYNLEARSQSEDRAHRIGQTKNVAYFDLRVRDSVDDRIIKVLKSKKVLTDDIVASNWRWFLGLAA